MFLSFTDWKTVKFKYIDFSTDNRFLSMYQAFSGKNLVPEAELTWLFVKGQESSLKFNWQGSRNKAKNLTTALQVTRVDSDLPPTFLFREIFEEMRSQSVLYLGEIQSGDIRMSLPAFNCWFWPARNVKEGLFSSGVLYLPRGELLTASKEESKSKPPFSEQAPNESTVLIRTEKGHMNFGFSTVGPMSIFYHGSRVSEDSAFESARVEAPGLKTAILITPTERLKGPKTIYYPGVLLKLGRANDEIYISTFSPFQEIRIATSKFSFGSGTVEDFFVKAPRGDLKLGTTSSKLDGGDEIFVKGLDLALSVSRDGTTALEGYSNHVIRNGVVETDTVWSKYKTELSIVLTVVLAMISLFKGLPWARRYLRR